MPLLFPPQVGVGPSRSRDEASRVWRFQQHRLEKLVAKLVTAILGSHPFYVNTFLGNYRTFATAQQVLDHLFRRYGCILPVTEEDGGPLHQLKHYSTSSRTRWGSPSGWRASSSSPACDSARARAEGRAVSISQALLPALTFSAGMPTVPEVSELTTPDYSQR
nr:ral guanine nucleotide dissociation stimulator-like isoform X3 [Camelus dromedarius]